MSEVYSLRTTPQGYRIVKFDDLLNPISIYEMPLRRGWVNCQCFAANKNTCRHREMIAHFVANDRVDKGWFYEYATGRWIKPIVLRRRK